MADLTLAAFEEVSITVDTPSYLSHSLSRVRGRPRVVEVSSSSSVSTIRCRNFLLRSNHILNLISCLDNIYCFVSQIDPDGCYDQCGNGG